MIKIGICMILLALVILTVRAFGAVRIPMTGAELPAFLIGLGMISGGILLIFLSGKGKKK